jgi:hypothetical protein
MSEPQKKSFPMRKRSGTAARRLAPAYSDFGLEDVGKLTELQAVEMLANAFWGSFTEMPCPHCGTIDAHYWRRRELRWKCKCCDKTFSVTSGTVFMARKLPLKKILGILVSWINGASGKPALQLMRDWRVAYGTAFTLGHKLREGVTRGFNTGVLCGVYQMDGLDMLGRGSREKRGQPQVRKPSGKNQFPEHLLRPAAELVGPPKPIKHDKKFRQHPDRRNLLVMRLKGVSKGMGAIATFVAVAFTENTKSVKAFATKHASSESAIMSDEDPAYASFSGQFAKHETVNHSVTFSTPTGVTNNLAESFNWRMKRAARGIYLNISKKYLKDYACEAAWREDVRELPTSKKLAHLLSMVGRVGMSLWWRGFSHGAHRDHEILVDGTKPAKARGRPKGWTPLPAR